MKVSQFLVYMLALLMAPTLAYGKAPHQDGRAARPSNPVRSACWKIYVLATRSHEEDQDASEKIRELLKSEKSSIVLHGVAVWALNREYSHHREIQCHICDRYEATRECALGALSECDNDEAARLLVSFLQEKNIRGNAHGNEMLYEAISRMGRRTLPYLLPMRNKNMVAKDLIDAFRRGK